MLITSKLQITKLKVSVLWFHTLVHQSLVHDQLERGLAGLHSFDQLAHTTERLIPVFDRAERLLDRVLQHCKCFKSVVDRARVAACRGRDYVRNFTRIVEPDVDGAIFDAHKC